MFVSVKYKMENPGELLFPLREATPVGEREGGTERARALGESSLVFHVRKITGGELSRSRARAHISLYISTRVATWRLCGRACVPPTIKMLLLVDMTTPVVPAVARSVTTTRAPAHTVHSTAPAAVFLNLFFQWFLFLLNIFY